MLQALTAASKASPGYAVIPDGALTRGSAGVVPRTWVTDYSGLCKASPLRGFDLDAVLKEGGRTRPIVKALCMGLQILDPKQVAEVADYERILNLLPWEGEGRRVGPIPRTLSWPATGGQG